MDKLILATLYEIAFEQGIKQFTIWAGARIDYYKKLGGYSRGSDRYIQIDLPKRDYSVLEVIFSENKLLDGNPSDQEIIRNYLKRKTFVQENPFRIETNGLSAFGYGVLIAAVVLVLWLVDWMVENGLINCETDDLVAQAAGVEWLGMSGWMDALSLVVMSLILAVALLGMVAISGETTTQRFTDSWLNEQIVRLRRAREDGKHVVTDISFEAFLSPLRGIAQKALAKGSILASASGLHQHEREAVDSHEMGHELYERDGEYRKKE